MRARPVEEIDVELVGAEPRQRRLARGDRAAPRRVMRQDLGDEEHLLAAAGDGLAHDPLGRARAVHLRGVDMRHAEIEPAPQGRDRALARAALDVPRALADDCDTTPRAAEAALLHAPSSEPRRAKASAAGPKAPRDPRARGRNACRSRDRARRARARGRNSRSGSGREDRRRHRGGWRGSGRPS